MDAPCFREWARLMNAKSDTLVEDAMIAATARVHGLTVATRNERDFAAFGVALLNPFLSNK
jgi:predicted nucleic acid-binding protein